MKNQELGNGYGLEGAGRGGLRGAALGPSVLAGRWPSAALGPLGAEDPKETKTAPPCRMLGRTCELGGGWEGWGRWGRGEGLPARTQGHSVQAGLRCPLHSPASVSPSHRARPPPALQCERAALASICAVSPLSPQHRTVLGCHSPYFQTRKQNGLPKGPQPREGKRWGADVQGVQGAAPSPPLPPAMPVPLGRWQTRQVSTNPGSLQPPPGPGRIQSQGKG